MEIKTSNICQQNGGKNSTKSPNTNDKEKGETETGSECTKNEDCKGNL
jgi:hypothetical protein